MTDEESSSIGDKGAHMRPLLIPNIFCLTQKMYPLSRFTAHQTAYSTLPILVRKTNNQKIIECPKGVLYDLLLINIKAYIDTPCIRAGVRGRVRGRNQAAHRCVRIPARASSFLSSHADERGRSSLPATGPSPR